MDKETLSNYGWIVICVMVLAVMLAFASPFGNFVANAIKSTTQGLFDVNQNALDAAGISIDDNVFIEGNGGASNPEYNHNAPTLHPNGAIPEGAYYMNLNTGTFYTEMPTTVNEGDMFLYGDYLYSYSSTNTGWSVMIATEDLGITTYIPDFICTTVNQNSYGPILESINGKPVTDISYTFSQCSSLTTAPEIPSCVTNMHSTFNGCKSLTDLSGLVIPNGVTDMTATFAYCTSLTIIPTIPNNVEKMWGTFLYCTSLTSVPQIPCNVINLGNTFTGCTSLTGTLAIQTNSINRLYDEGTADVTENSIGTCGYCFEGVDMTNITLTGSASKDVLNLLGSTGKNWTPIS